MTPACHRPRGPRRTAGVAALLIASICLGCNGPTPPPPPPPPLRSTTEIVAAVRRNALLLDRPLRSQTVDVAARFTDETGKTHAYNLQGSFLFQPPRNLRIDLRPGLGEQVMQIGSNDEDYWIWIEPEEKSMRWGRHRHAGKPCTEHPGMRPDQLIEAMGVIDLPGADAGLLGPVRVFGKTYDILEYLRPQFGGGLLLDREYWIDRVEPFQVRLVLFRDEYGRKSMSAMLDDYRPAWDGGPHVAHQISVVWHDDNGAFTVWMAKVTGIPAVDVSPRAFVRPTPEQGLPPGVENVIQVDADCDE